MKRPQLTPAQKSCLIVVFTDGQFRCANNYKPAQKLIALGLVDSTEDKFGSVTLLRTEKTVEYARTL